MITTPAEIRTIDDLLEVWDQGGTIWSLEMGGLGPDYERAIQVAAVEFARAGKSMPRTEDAKADWDSFDKICTEKLKEIDADLGGLSGAMYGAAVWLAWNWCFNGGPARLCERAKEHNDIDRALQVRGKPVSR